MSLLTKIKNRSILGLMILTTCLSQSTLGLADTASARDLIASDFTFLHVDKGSLEAELKTWPIDGRDSEVLMTFRIAIGKEEGDKQVEGDNRTPEGIYFTQKLIDGKTLPAKYGPFAIPIDFPNPYDRSRGKTGYGIWLHGVEKDARVEESKVTEGCVAFYNADIEYLAGWITPDQTIVVISDGKSEVNRSEDLRDIRLETIDWLDAWQQRSIDRYISHYHPDFKNRSRNVAKYKKYKQRVFSSYENMDVKLTDLRVFAHKSYAIAIFNQDFNGDDRYLSVGGKVLYFKKDDNKWKITHEVFRNDLFKQKPLSKESLVEAYSGSPSMKLLAKKKKQEEGS